MKHIKEVCLLSLICLMIFGCTVAFAAQGTIAGSYVNIRSDAGTSFSRLAQLSKGYQVNVLGSKTGKDQMLWYNISFGQTVGWVRSDLLNVQDEAQTTKADSVSARNGVVTASSLNVRQSGSVQAARIGSLPNQSLVTILQEQNGWYQINYGSGTGWVCGTYISLSQDLISRASFVSREQQSASKQQEVVDYAKTLLGIKYVYGGSSTSGFDCSGFVQYVFKHFGVNLPRTADAQATVGQAVSKDQLQPGDIVYFDTNGGTRGVNHVGIYIGDNQFIHASSAKSKILITGLSGFYNGSAYMGATRVI